MTKTFKIMDNKAEFKQKGWMLFGAVFALQVLVLGAGYLLYNI